MPNTVPRLPGGDVAQYAYDAGFRNITRQDLTIAVAVAAAESAWRPSAHALSSIEDSRGLWQINVWAHPEYASVNLYNPTVNARAAHRVWQNSGGNWTPWSTYTNGAYLQYINTAEDAVRARGYSVSPVLVSPGSVETPFSWDGAMAYTEQAAHGEARRRIWRGTQIRQLRWHRHFG